MSDLLKKASEWLENQRVKHMTCTVFYLRGAESIEVAATIGKTVFEIDDGIGARTQFEARDFLILADDLILDGRIVLPERGDRVQEVQTGKTFLYEVLAPGKEPCWRYSDPYRKTLRIHTKQVGTEEN
jgi:hypothetical protein